MTGWRDGDDYTLGGLDDYHGPFARVTPESAKATRKQLDAIIETYKQGYHYAPDGTTRPLPFRSRKIRR